MKELFRSVIFLALTTCLVAGCGEDICDSFPDLCDPGEQCTDDCADDACGSETDSCDNEQPCGNCGKTLDSFCTDADNPDIDGEICTEYTSDPSLVNYLSDPITSYSAAPVVRSFDQDFDGGKVRVHYDEASPSSTVDAVFLGIGTAMGRHSYDKLSSAIVKHGYVVVIMDHVPGNMQKQDAGKYRNAAGHVKAHLLDWLSNTNISEISHWIMGGHSGGGQAAQGAVSDDETLADAIFSIDPYNSNNAGHVSVPAMYWGFNVTTCFVTKDDAAKAAYHHSLTNRAFYRVERKYRWTWCGYSPKFFHCSFADGDCPMCTNCKYNPDYFYVDVANSVDKFINAAFYGTWSKANLQINSTTPLTLFEGNDNP
jgi:hypothetical protein